MGIRILGTGSYLPETVVDNQAFTAIVDTSDEWIVKHSGTIPGIFMTALLMKWL